MVTATLVMVLALTGCAWRSGDLGQEPAFIVIRNRSGMNLQFVTLGEVPGGKAAGGRFGSIAPVPDNVDQSVERAANPSRLPRAIAVHWAGDDGREHYQDVVIAEVLRGVGNSRREALVFEFGRTEEVRVYLQSVSD